ncbi:MAG TPA: protein kinase [Ignavibacteriales bacterium]|nr:protein kinase [Ignavibacteriales bacterium]
MIGQTISHYKILEKLGEGGMGVVYKAEDQKLKRTVAIKVLPGSFIQDELSKKRFINEAQTASSLQHNNICTIHEIDELPGGGLFIVMDYYEGETLKNKISSGPLEISEIIELTTQIAEGLKKAHENGIIHRDIKPANIFITNDGTVKILDFGLAKKKDQTLFTRIGSRFGTIDYMSPEQIKGEKVDLRADIWSLGIILYEMLTGEHPFKADYEQAIIYLILNQEPEKAEKFRSDIPERLLRILEKSMAKDKEDRYETLSILLEDLINIAAAREECFHLPAPKPSHSIAVMPFVNMSTDKEQDSFCDGLTEELINALSNISDLKVVARTSAFAFKGSGMDLRNIGRKLDVRTVLEGSVRKSGNNLRITAQLINVMDGYHLWSQRYDREIKDIFKIQDDISLAIAEVLKVKLLKNEKERILKRYTDNIEAYNFFQHGFYFFNQLDLNILERSIKYFNQALEIDPNYALAYIGLAGCYFAMNFFGIKRSAEAKPAMKKFIEKALEIDDNLCEAYYLLALYQGCLDHDQSAAESSYRRSLEINPNSTMALQNYSILQVNNGHLDTARKLAARAKLLDPLSDYVELCALFPEFYDRKYEEIIHRLENFQKSDPPFWWGFWYLWRTLSLLNRKPEAVEVLKKTFSIIGMGGIVTEMGKAGIDNSFSAAADTMAEIYKQRYVSPYVIAILFSHAGELDKSFLYLEKALEENDSQLEFIFCDPEWDGLRCNPLFIKWNKRLGFNI